MTSSTPQPLACVRLALLLIALTTWRPISLAAAAAADTSAGFGSDVEALISATFGTGWPLRLRHQPLASQHAAADVQPQPSYESLAAAGAGGHRREAIGLSPPAAPIQQVPGPGDVGHNNPDAQPQCRAYWDVNAGLVCFVNMVWLASTYWEPSSLFGRALLYLGAQQAACNRHANVTSCLADRSHFCAPLRLQIPGGTFDCVVFGTPLPLAYTYLFNSGAAFCCPGSRCARQWRCLSVNRPWANYTGVDRQGTCRAAGCSYSPTLDSCIGVAGSPHSLNSLPAAPTLRDMGNCSTSQYFVRYHQTAAAAKSYSACPYQTGNYDPSNNQCNWDLYGAQATDADDLAYFAMVENNQGFCQTRGGSVAQCEAFGAYVYDGQGPAVIDEGALAQYVKIDITNLSTGAAPPRPDPTAVLWVALVAALLMVAGTTLGGL